MSFVENLIDVTLHCQFFLCSVTENASIDFVAFLLILFILLSMLSYFLAALLCELTLVLDLRWNLCKVKHETDGYHGA